MCALLCISYPTAYEMHNVFGSFGCVRLGLRCRVWMCTNQQTNTTRMTSNVLPGLYEIGSDLFCKFWRLPCAAVGFSVCVSVDMASPLCVRVLVWFIVYSVRTCLTVWIFLHHPRYCRWTGFEVKVRTKCLYMSLDTSMHKSFVVYPQAELTSQYPTA